MTPALVTDQIDVIIGCVVHNVEVTHFILRVRTAEATISRHSYAEHADTITYSYTIGCDLPHVDQMVSVNCVKYTPRSL